MPLRYIVPTIVRRSVLSSLDGQGMGRFSYDDMLVRASKDLQVIESLLDQGSFLFGQIPVVGCYTASHTCVHRLDAYLRFWVLH